MCCPLDYEPGNRGTGSPGAYLSRIYGDWQASEYLGDVLAELKPRRKVNLPDFPAIVRAAMADGMDICVYCQSFGCNECIVNEWKSERSDEE